MPNTDQEPAITTGEGSAPLKPSEVLERAAALIEPEGAWIQGFIARRRDGFPTSVKAGGSCWCLLGAVAEAAPGDYATAWGFVKQTTSAVPVAWNDRPERTQAEVVTALREAAELARSEGQ
jgi:hypothetical protein